MKRLLLFSILLIAFSGCATPTSQDDSLFGMYDSSGAFVFFNSKGEKAFQLKGVSYAQKISEGFAAVLKNEKWGFVNVKGKTVIPCSYEEALSFSEGLAAVKQNGEWGYIDKNGETVIPCQYDHAGGFSEGLAWVSKDEYWGIINSAGETIVPCQLACSVVYPFTDEMAGFLEQGLTGFVNKHGEVVIAPKDDISPYFHGGLARIMRDGKYGFVNTRGAVTIPCQYDRAFDYAEGLAAVMQNNRWGYINPAGEMVIPYLYTNASTEFSNGFAWVQHPNKRGWEIINSNGEIIGHGDGFETVAPFTKEGLARVEQKGKWGYANSKGELVIPCEYDDAEDFTDGLAFVEQDGLYGLINPEGELVVPCQFASPLH